MNDTEIKQKLTNILVEILGYNATQITDNATIGVTGEISGDDLDMIEVAMSIEEEFGIALEDLEWIPCDNRSNTTVRQTVELIKQKLSQSNTGGESNVAL